MRHSLLLVLLVVLTMTPRLSAGDHAKGGDGERLLEDVAAALEKDGWKTEYRDRVLMDNIAIVDAECEYSVAADYHNGERLSAFRNIQPDSRRIHLFYRGQPIERLPRLRPAFNYYAQRHLARLGISYEYQPVIMLAADSGCEVPAFDFSGLRVYPVKSREIRLLLFGEIPYLLGMERENQFIGQSGAFLDAVERASRAAPMRRPVLVVGERGTGKELIAERLHRLSDRWEEPLVILNCAALPETLIEAELFGHEAGAFTGATRAREGRFEEANGGTLFLDELATLSMGAQERLLRAV